MSDVHPTIAALAARTGLPDGAVGLAVLAYPGGECEPHRKDWDNAEALVARGWATLEPIPRLKVYRKMRLTDAGRAHLYRKEGTPE